jgi:hypothetical protein
VPCKLELAEEKSKLAQLGQQNGFGPAFLHSLFEASKKGTAKPNTCYSFGYIVGVVQVSCY